ncbi:MAG: hypothetical protein XD78_0658 [Desulfotomaculum sp. 46_296]|nr:MAG: hypothetical protein XD78_0658 [Desulfotomaculum sp. 46_296]HAU31508.1 hypothetical protein [Desulfotomaculum sp.]
MEENAASCFHFNQEASLEDTQPMGVLELIYGILFDPADTFKKVAEAPPLGLSVLIFSLVNITVIFMSFLNFFHLLNINLPAGSANLTLAIMLLVVFLGLIVKLCNWLLSTSVFHLLAELLGGRGSVKGLLAIVGLSYLPFIFLAPVELLLLIWGLKSIVVVIVMILNFLIFIWWLALMVLGVRQEYCFSAGSALAAVFLPISPFIFLLILPAFLITIAVILISICS